MTKTKKILAALFGRVLPTLEQVLEAQRNASNDTIIDAFIDDRIGEADLAERIPEADIANVPVNLSLVTIQQKMVAVRIVANAKAGLKDLFDANDLKFNRFFLMGEVYNAPGHVIVVSQSGKVYPMWHSEIFEIIPEDDM